MTTSGTKTNIRLSTMLSTGSEIIRKEGISALFKHFISIIFMNEEILIFQKPLKSIAEVEPSLDNFALKVISTKKDLTDLIKNGFDMSFFNAYELQRRVEQGEVLFAGFVGDLLVHKSCVLMHATPTIDSPIPIDWSKEAYIQFVETAPRYRGRHIYPFVSSQVFEYARERGKSVCTTSTTTKNISSQRAHRRAGYRVCGRGRYLRLFLFFEFWRDLRKTVV